MNIITLFSNKETALPIIDTKRKASGLSVSTEEDSLAEQFSKALKITYVNNDTTDNWHITKRKVQEDSEETGHTSKKVKGFVEMNDIEIPFNTKRKIKEVPEDSDHASKKVKSAIEVCEEEIPFKSVRKEERSAIENERKRVKPTFDNAPQDKAVFEFDADAPSWDDIDELELLLPALAILKRLESETLDRIVACLSKRDMDKYPIVANHRVFSKLIEECCSFAEISRDKIVAIFSIRNKHGTCLLTDVRLYHIAFPYLESLIDRDPNLLFDLLTIQDKRGNYAFMGMELSQSINELLGTLAALYPERILKMIQSPLVDGRMAITNHWTFCEFLNVVGTLPEKQPTFVWKFFSLITQNGEYYLKRPEYIEPIVKCLSEMGFATDHLVEKIMTYQYEGKSMLSYQEFTLQAKPLLKNYPRLQPIAAVKPKAPAVASRHPRPFGSKTDIINRPST